MHLFRFSILFFSLHSQFIMNYWQLCCLVTAKAQQSNSGGTKTKSSETSINVLHTKKYFFILQSQP